METRATVNEDGTLSVPMADLERYIGKDCDISIKIHREGRSKDANAYFHVLCRKMAEIANISLLEMKNRLLADYGQADTDFGQIKMRYGVDWTKQEIHLSPTGDYDGEYAYYELIRGSHTYNTEEMSKLIDRTVVEANLMGVETLPPDEIKRMEVAWQAQGKAQETKEPNRKGS